jgi:hypothetical protein
MTTGQILPHFSFGQVMVVFVLLSFFFWSGDGSICPVVIFLLVR